MLPIFNNQPNPLDDVPVRHYLLFRETVPLLRDIFFVLYIFMVHVAIATFTICTSPLQTKIIVDMKFLKILCESEIASNWLGSYHAQNGP